MRCNSLSCTCVVQSPVSWAQAQRAGDLAGARAHFRAAAELAPELAMAHASLAKTLQAPREAHRHSDLMASLSLIG